MIKPRVNNLLKRIPALPFSLSVFIPLFIIFLLTARYTRPLHIDPTTNAITAWHLGTSGSPLLPEYADATKSDHQGVTGWIIQGPRGPVSLYPPGAALLAAPLYAIFSAPLIPIEVTRNEKSDPLTIPYLIPPIAPATVIASLTSALSLMLLATLVLTLGGTRLESLCASYIAAFGTSIWSVSADQLWQHGPAVMWIFLALLLGARNRWSGSGLVHGLSILTRPLTTVIPFILAGYLFLKTKRSTPSFLLIFGVLPGIFLLSLYNYYAFGALTLSGGYGNRFDNNLVNGSLVWTISNVWNGLFDLHCGIFIASPFLFILMFGLPRASKSAPQWCVGSAFAGVFYILLSWRAEDYRGGAGFYSYRYPLEGLAAMAPLLFLSYKQWIVKKSIRRKIFLLSVLSSVLFYIPSLL